MKLVQALALLLSGLPTVLAAPRTQAADIVQDAEYYILEAQNGEKWAAEDRDLDARLEALRAKHGRPPNIVYILWDDTTFGAVGMPALQKNFGFTTPNLNRMAADGINFTRMYTEPSCTPTRVAFLTGRHPVRSGMGEVGMPHEMAGLRDDEVTIAEVLSEAGYSTAHFGKGHLGDIEESYLHNQGFDETLFTPMNQIVSQWNQTGDAVGAARGFWLDNYPPDPYGLDNPGLLPSGLVMAIEGRKGEQGHEWKTPSLDAYNAMDPECEKRTLDFIRRNAEAGKPFFVEYWPNLLALIKTYPKKKTQAGTMVSEELQVLDDFVGRLREELERLGVTENTLIVAMADNGPMVHSPPPQFGMLSLMYRGGKGDFLEGGVRVPAFAAWPGMIDEGQTVGDIVHVTDLYTTFARLAGATEHIPTDRVIDGIDQTALLMNGDTHSRRDYVFIYTGQLLGATVKGRYKRHWLGGGEVAASGMPEAYYDLYVDTREDNPMLVPLIHTQGQFNRMRARHELMKKQFPNKKKAYGVPYTGLANARPETREIANQMKRNIQNLPIDVQDYLEFEIPGAKADPDFGE
ncbi:Putative sulfatase AslA [Durusdinium trenchii]|uniref:Sulfatase AslA n=1 Tax=Durusdinium trenchii TaxID=1381693 RepID=A0ABP0KAI7_9DINO